MNPFSALWNLIISFFRWLFGIKDTQSIVTKNGVYETESFILPNGLRVMLIRRNNFRKTGLKLTFEAGQIYDPKDLPGLSELVANIAMDGSSAYPTGYLNSFLIGNSGISGSIAQKEESVNHLFIEDSQVEKLTKILVSALMNPQFEEQSIRKKIVELKMKNEKQAKEYLGNNSVLNEDFFYMALDESLPEHSNNLLSTDVADSPDIIARIRDFHSKYFKPERMRLTIASKLPMRELKRIVNQFNQLPINDQKEPSLLKEPDNLKLSDKFAGKLIKYKCTESPNFLTLNILFPPLFELFKHGYGKNNILGLYTVAVQFKKFPDYKDLFESITLDYSEFYRMSFTTIKYKLSSIGMDNLGKVFEFIEMCITKIGYDLRTQKMIQKYVKLTPENDDNIYDVIEFYSQLPYCMNYKVDFDYEKVNLKDIQNRAIDKKNWFATLSVNEELKNQVGPTTYSDPISIESMIPVEGDKKPRLEG